MRKILMFIRQVLLAPMMLLVGVEGDDAPAGAPAGAEPSAGSGTQTTPTGGTGTTPTASDIATELLNAIAKRNQRTEGTLTRSIAEKYGMTEQEVSDLLEAEKARRDKALPAEVQQQIDTALAAANDRLIGAEIRAQATVLGFLDADDALQLLDRSGVKVDDKGNVTGVKEALEALAKAKPHLVKKSGAWGQRQGTGAGAEKTRRDEIRDQLYGGN